MSDNPQKPNRPQRATKPNHKRRVNGSHQTDRPNQCLLKKTKGHHKERANATKKDKSRAGQAHDTREWHLHLCRLQSQMLYYTKGESFDLICLSLTLSFSCRITYHMRLGFILFRELFGLISRRTNETYVWQVFPRVVLYSLFLSISCLT